MYIEGVRTGERLIEAVKNHSENSCGGHQIRTVGTGAIAAASHTGSLAGSDEIFDAIMRQCGVLRAENGGGLQLVQVPGQYPFPAGENTVIITNGAESG
jgi:acyl-CoA synthetase (NDP forming)